MPARPLPPSTQCVSRPHLLAAVHAVDPSLRVLVVFAERNDHVLDHVLFLVVVLLNHLERVGEVHDLLRNARDLGLHDDVQQSGLLGVPVNHAPVVEDKEEDESQW